MTHDGGHARPSPAFQFYPDQFMADTVGLSPAERGAFVGLVCAAWRHRSLPSDPARLRLIAGVSEADWPATWKAVALLGFQDGDRWRIPFVDEAIARQDAYRSMQREKGLKGGRPTSSKAKKAAANPRDSVTKPRPSSSSSSSNRTSHPSGAQSLQAPPAGGPAPAPAPIRQFTDGFCSRFEAAFHRPYAFEGPKDGKAARDILALAGGDVAEALRRADVYLDDPWVLEHGGNLVSFKAAWNKLAHAPGTNGNGRGAPAAPPRAVAAFQQYLESKNPPPPGPAVIDVPKETRP